MIKKTHNFCLYIITNERFSTKPVKHCDSAC